MGFQKEVLLLTENYMVTYKEILSLVESLWNFKHILIGNQITEYTDHKNINYASTNYTSERVLRKHLEIDAYGVNVKFIEGKAAAGCWSPGR